MLSFENSQIPFWKLKSELVNKAHPDLVKLVQDYMEYYHLSDYDRKNWDALHKYKNFGKIWVIKGIREVTGLGLREAKELVEIFEGEELFAGDFAGDDIYLDAEEAKLLYSAGFTFGPTRGNRKSRMIRAGERSVTPSCEHTAGKEVEWRIVGEYEIRIAKFCPECGKPVGGK